MSMLMTSGAVLGGMVLGALLVRFQARRFAVKAVPGALNEAHMGFLLGVPRGSRMSGGPSW